MKVKKIPMRMCVGCKDLKPKNHGLEKSLKRPVSKDVYEALKAQIENG